MKGRGGGVVTVRLIVMALCVCGCGGGGRDVKLNDVKGELSCGGVVTLG